MIRLAKVISPALLVVFGLLGCAGSETYLRVLESQGQLRIDPAHSPTHDYLVHVGNVGDLGYNPDDQETRNRVAISALHAQCPRARVVGETVIERGTHLLGHAARTYIIQVKC